MQSPSYARKTLFITQSPGRGRLGRQTGGTELVTRVKRKKQDSAPALRLVGLIPRSSGGLRSRAPQMGLPGLTQLPHCWGEENGFSWTSGKAEAAVLPARPQEELTKAPAGA